MQELSELAMPRLGDVVDGKYRIQGLIGQGAMGCVYRAAHATLGHHVAIKFLRAAVDNDSLRARFVREARATMTLRNEHVVRVFDLGFLPSTMPYMVLEFLEGTDLRSLLDRGQSLSTEEAVDYVLQVCEALAEAHLHGIVHRDLKPQNLFRIQRPNGSYCIKLLDFGVSKFQEVAAPEHELTTSQILLGSPAFMPPEQIRSSSRVDSRADIWSLGVVLYMLLGGGRPFDGEGLPSLCAAIMVDPPRPLAARLPSVPPALEAVIFRCLEKSRERRYGTVGEVATALEPFASDAGRGSAARVRQVCASPPPALDVRIDLDADTPADGVDATAILPTPDARATERTAEEPAPVSAPPRRRRLARGLGAAALLVLVATGAVITATSARAPRAHRAPLLAKATRALPTEPAPPAAAEPAPLAAAERVEMAPAAVRASAPRGRTHTVTSLSSAPITSSKKKRGTLDRNGIPILD